MKAKYSTSSFAASLVAVTLSTMPAAVQGHGYLLEPPSRNYIASIEGVEDTHITSGLPPKENCPECLNRNGGVCGNSYVDATDYDTWLDSAGEPMPFEARRRYKTGQTIEIRSKISNGEPHGHVEVRGCPLDQATNQACFDKYKFEFMLGGGSISMPKGTSNSEMRNETVICSSQSTQAAFCSPRDCLPLCSSDSSYPERGYYIDTVIVQGSAGSEVVMHFKVPDNLVGEQVILQWQHVAADTCNPPGYTEYFDIQNDLPECELPYLNDGTTDVGSPERHWNCAEVRVDPAARSSPPEEDLQRSVVTSSSSSSSSDVGSHDDPPTSRESRLQLPSYLRTGRGKASTK